MVWAFGLGIKMTILLAAPAIGIILLQAQGTKRAVICGCFVLLVHVNLAIPFITGGAGLQYLQRAFDLGRQFLFKWTVNWRFVGEEAFLSPQFAISLLIIHVSLLLLFLQTKWTKPSASNLVEFFREYVWFSGESEPTLASRKITPTFVMDAVLGSMVIGMLCARSLHYQFFAYLGWATPYLLWRAGGGPKFGIGGD